MLLTICTIRQLPQAFALADSFCQYSAQPKNPKSVLIGLADDPTQLPFGFVSPYPLLPVADWLPATELAALSSVYTPTEFVAAVKPAFIAEAFRSYPTINQFVYADPNIQFVSSLTPIWEQLTSANLLLTPHITQSPNDGQWPDEKYFQNVGLYSSDFLVFRRSAETDRLLAWWDDRVRERAYINACEGLCLDQIWLMHIPVFFRDVRVIRNPGWHVALWNLPERTIRQEGTSWRATGPTAENQPVQFVNVKGLHNPDEGLFPHQTRLRLSERPDVETLLTQYRQTLSPYNSLPVKFIRSAYGQLPEPVVLHGWRYAAVRSMKRITHFLDHVSIPAIS